MCSLRKGVPYPPTLPSCSPPVHNSFNGAAIRRIFDPNDNFLFPGLSPLPLYHVSNRYSILYPLFISFKKINIQGVPIVVQQKRIHLRTMRLQVWSLPLLSGLTIQRCHELWCRSQTSLDPVLLWLWHRLVATALIRPWTWEPPYATRVAQEMAKRPKKKKKIQYLTVFHHPSIYLWLLGFLYYF